MAKVPLPERGQPLDVPYIYKLVDTVNQSASTEKTFFLEFTDFKFAPIVSATLENIGGTPAGKNVNVILTSVTTSRVDGFVRFGESGNLAIAVNLIIVGIPN